jgi:hypothetical protein
VPCVLAKARLLYGAFRSKAGLDIYFRSQSKVLALGAGRNYSLHAPTAPYLREGNDSMKRIVGLLLQCVCLFGAALPVMAHHSFAAEFDDKKP